MPRRGHLEHRRAPGDSVYGSQLASDLIKKVMLDGKKSLAESIVYGSFERIRSEVGKNPVEVLEEGLKNVMPAVEVRPRRVGGATYQVPMEVRPERRTSLGLRWILQYARARGEKTMVDRLAGELIDASNGVGGSVKKREDTHRMAEANRAFAHYRW